MAKQLGGVYYVHDQHWVDGEAAMTADLKKAKAYGFNFALLSCWQEHQDKIALAFNAAMAANLKLGILLESTTLPVKLRAQFAHQLLDKYGSHPKIFKYRGKPLVLVYSPAWTGTVPLWEAELPSLKSKATMVCDNVRPEWVVAFDGCYNYNIDTLVKGEQNATFYANLKGIYQQITTKANAAGKFFIPTLMAKFDDSAFRNPSIVLNEQEGSLLWGCWEALRGLECDLAIVTSLNELAENSNVLHNSKYLNMVKQIKTFWLNYGELWVNPLNQTMPS